MNRKDEIPEIVLVALWGYRQARRHAQTSSRVKRMRGGVLSTLVLAPALASAGLQQTLNNAKLADVEWKPDWYSSRLPPLWISDTQRATIMVTVDYRTRNIAVVANRKWFSQGPRQQRSSLEYSLDIFHTILAAAAAIPVELAIQNLLNHVMVNDRQQLSLPRALILTALRTLAAASLKEAQYRYVKNASTIM